MEWDERSPGELSREVLLAWGVVTLKDSILALRLEFTTQGREADVQSLQVTLGPETAIALARALQTRGEICLRGPSDGTIRQ
jgi:hypothetical protein